MPKTRLAGAHRLVYRPLGYGESGGGDAPERGEESREDANRQTRSLAGLAAALAVLVVCLFLFKQLSHIAAVDDCLLSGQKNCDLLLARLR